MKLNLIILSLFIVSLIDANSATLCPDGSACPNKNHCCETLYEYYRCCPISQDCCFDGMRCCSPMNSQFLSELNYSTESQSSIVE